MVQEIVPFIKLLQLKRKKLLPMSLLTYYLYYYLGTGTYLGIYLSIFFQSKNPLLQICNHSSGKTVSQLLSLVTYFLTPALVLYVQYWYQPSRQQQTWQLFEYTEVGKLLKTFLYVVGGNLTQVLSRFKVLITSNTAMGMTRSNFSPLLQIKVKLYNPPPSFSLLPQ